MSLYDVQSGENFYQFIRRIQIQMGRDNRNGVHISFNDITFCVHPESYIDDMCLIYDLKCEIRRLKA